MATVKSVLPACTEEECLSSDELLKTGNIFKDIVDNIVEILKREQRQDKNSRLSLVRRLTEIYDDDVIMVPRTPCVAVSFEGWTEGVRTIGQQYPQAMHVEAEILVHYYHQELSDKIRKNDIRDALWELSRILRRNSDLNGLSTKGAGVMSGEIAIRQKQNKVYVGGVIRMTVPVLFNERRGRTPVLGR